MSDEHKEQGRDGSAPAAASDDEQHPVPAYAGSPAQPQQSYPPQQPQQPGPAWGAGVPWGGGAGGAGGGPGAPQAGAYPPPPPNGRDTALLERPRPNRGRAGVVVAALIAGLVGGGAAGAGTVALLDRSSGGTTLSQSPASSNAGTAAPGSIAAVAAKVMPSTVDIQVNLANGSAEGSGVILTADGDVLTNNHVVSGAQGDITVTLSDGSQHTATVVGTSPSYDLAVIKIQGVSGLTPATLGRSSDVQVGQQVVAIGSPQGLTGTVTNGIISALNRTVAVQGENRNSSVVYNGLQTDAPINPGNSGGPLINLDGQVVGINSAIATAGSTAGSGSQGGSIGLGFAIPVDQAKRVAQEIMNTGSATKPVLGVTGSVSGSQADSTTGGAKINSVEANSPAAAAGLKSGDVVTKVGDARVQNFADLIARIGSYTPGAKITLTVQSGGATKAVDVTLGSQTDKAASTANGGGSANPFGGQNPFGNFGQNPFGGGN